LFIATVRSIASATMKDDISRASFDYYGHGGRLPNCCIPRSLDARVS
jgi:hypothetical protein